MLMKVFGRIILGGMTLIGLLFVSNISVIGNTASAIQMHEDLPLTASPLLVNIKVIITFIAGILFLIAAFAIISKKYNLSLAGVFGFAIFDGFYLIELAMWSGVHPQIWTYFFLAGGIAFLFGIFCWYSWTAGRIRQCELLRDI